MKPSSFSLFLLLFITVASGADAAPLTLADALARVDAHHPWLRTRETTAALAAARTTGAAARPAPEVSLEFENALGTGEFRAARSLETTLQFSRAFDFNARRAARAHVASSLNEIDRLAWEERRLALLAETARRFIRVAAAEADLRSAHELAALARETIDLVETRLAHAAASSSDRARARLTHAEATLEAEHAEHLLLTARQSLATLWASDVPDFDHAVANLTNLPSIPDYDVLAPRLKGTPVQARFAGLARWRLAQEQLARNRASRGELRWAAGIRRDEASDAFGFVLGLSHAWPTRDLANAHATEARVEHDRTAAEQEIALLDARDALFGLYQELNHARIEHDAARDEMIPAAQDWLAGIEAGATAGRYGVRDLIEARTALFAARRRQIDAAAEYHTTLVAIEQLLGSPAQL